MLVTVTEKLRTPLRLAHLNIRSQTERGQWVRELLPALTKLSHRFMTNWRWTHVSLIHKPLPEAIGRPATEQLREWFLPVWDCPVINLRNKSSFRKGAFFFPKNPAFSFGNTDSLLQHTIPTAQLFSFAKLHYMSPTSHSTQHSI